MLLQLKLSVAAGVMALLGAAACGSDTVTEPPPAECPSAALSISGTDASATMQTLGGCLVTSRYTAEIVVHGSVAYTTTWGARFTVGNAIYVWDTRGNVPGLIDSVIVTGGFTTLGDVAVSDDGKLLVVATERTPGSIVIFDLADPRHPRELSRFTNDDTNGGVHTAEIGRVNGKLYAFLAIDPVVNKPARVVTVDLSNPSSPKAVFMRIGGTPYLHDTYARDGLLFVALWNDGMQVWDMGGAGNGSPENPRVIGSALTVGGKVHNLWWYHDANGSKRYVFVGEEGSGIIGSLSAGDIHVLDVTDMTKPLEVAFYHVDGAGTHNFSVDESRGILYAAYYNGGVRAIDVRGDLGTCTKDQQAAGSARCDLRLMGRELGVGLLDQQKPVYIWGVQYQDGYVYASDMLNGIWKLRALSR
jgi:hypothetical protein